MTKRKNNLKPKHELYAKNLIKHNGNQKMAYLETYPTCSVSSASAMSSRLIKQHPEIIEEVKYSLNRQGVTIDKLSQKLAQLIDAQKTIIVDNDTVLVSDNPSQLKAVELGMKAHGVLKDVDNSTTYNVQVNQQLVLDKLGERMDKVLEMLGYNIGTDAEGRKVIHNLSTGYPQPSRDISKDNGKLDVLDVEIVADSDSTSGAGGSVED